jgi:hypothetical protein
MLTRLLVKCRAPRTQPLPITNQVIVLPLLLQAAEKLKRRLASEYDIPMYPPPPKLQQQQQQQQQEQEQGRGQPLDNSDPTAEGSGNLEADGDATSRWAGAEDAPHPYHVRQAALALERHANSMPEGRRRWAWAAGISSLPLHQGPLHAWPAPWHICQGFSCLLSMCLMQQPLRPHMALPSCCCSSLCLPALCPDCVRSQACSISLRHLPAACALAPPPAASCRA